MSLKFGKHALLVLAVLLMLVLIPTSFAENVADGNVVGANGDSAIDSVQQVAVGNMGDDIQQVANDEIVFESAADDMVIVSDESDVLGYGEEYITSPSPTNITDYHIGDSKDIVVTPTIDEGCRSEIENYLDEVYVYIDDDFDGRIVIPDVGTTSAFNFNLNAFTADQLSVGTHTLRFGVDYKSLENRGYSTALNPLTVTVVSGEGDEPGGDINVIYVDAKNRNDSADGSKENPFATIARAIEENAARGGNWTIIVNVGDYCLSDVVISDDVTIKFEKDASIDANGTSVFIVKNGASLTLINADIFGAVNAIVTEANTTLTIVDSMFTVNDGVIVSNGSTTIYRTHFFLNDGTVIKADEGSLDVSYSIFDQNNGTLIDSGIQATANDNFWGTNLPNDLENVTIDTWVVLIASFEEAPDIFTGVMYNITVEFISNDGSDLGDILPRCYPEAEATLGVVEGYIIIEQNYGVANYIATEVGSGVINIFSDSLLQSIPVNATAEDTNTTINATVNGFVVTIIVNVNATGIVNEGNVKLTFNNQTKTASVVNGVAKFTFDNVNAGTYNIAANYEGTTLFNPSNATSSVKVVKLQAYVKPIYKVFVFNYGHLYQFTLKDKAGNPIAGRTVLFSIHGKYYSAVTNSKGVGQIKITPKMLITAGKFFTRLTFKGDGQYKAHSYPIWITALKETTKLSVKSGSYKISANKVVTATLKDSKNKIIKNKVVYIKINGKTVSAKTDAKGVATFKLNNVPFNKVGKYAFTVTFKEDKAYKQSTAKGTLTIT